MSEYRLEMHNVVKTFPGVKALNGAQLNLRPGSVHALMGENGAGKSTLMKMILGQVKGEGSSYIADWLKIGYFEQLQELRLSSSKTTIDFVWDDFPRLNRTQIQSALAMFKLYGDQLQKPVNTLSGGEAAKVILLKIMLEGPNLLLLDEPTNHLDLDARDGLIEALSDYKGTMLIISHDRAMINALATKLLFLRPDSVETFAGNYDSWRESLGDKPSSAFGSSEEKSPTQEKPKVNTYKQQKEQQSLIRKLHTRVKRLEDEIEAVEREMKEINERLSQGSSDYQQVMEDSNRLSELEAEQERLMEEWENASAAAAEAENGA
ncbi:MAG: ATP-binding cassette domain-containing protein [Ruminiclostridium sp.]|nr:ATP-binding cassette domain-containing protein [Ruminiclostridium sp.]